jgi:hypothetical protein
MMVTRRPCKFLLQVPIMTQKKGGRVCSWKLELS